MIPASLLLRASGRIGDRMMLLSFFFLIAFGNLFRFIELFEKWNYLLITEMSLYLFFLLSKSFFVLGREFLFKVFIFSLLLSTSFFYGWLHYGYDQVALLYAVRFVMLLLTARAIGLLCIRRFHGQIVPFFAWLLKGYAIATIASLVIYLVFPESERLWGFLTECNIKFQGDPHCNRLISVYFDPNFYGAIACIPFLLSSFLCSYTKKMSYFLFLFVLVVTIFLTQSRSGIALFCALFGWMGFCYVKRTGLFCKCSRKLFIFSLSAIIASLGFLAYKGLFVVIVNRVLGVGYDPSAGFRFVAWKNGIEEIRQHPIFGIGYNFVHREELWVDSSLLLMCITMGICSTLCLLAYGGYLLRNLYLMYRGTTLQPLVSSFLFYIFFSVFFYSFFNNLIFYIFWALPVLVIYHFLKNREICEEIL